MTAKEITTALECCKKDDCDNCPNDFGNCYANLAGCSLDLISRKQAEIEALKIENQALRSAANSYKIHYDEARAEAVKEFAERLKARIIEDFLKYNTDTTIGYIDTLVREMVGDTE